MRYRSALLLLCVISSAAAQALSDGTLAIFLRNERVASGITLAIMQQEAQLAVSPAGVRIVWSSASSQIAPVSTRVAVVNLEGTCRPDARLPAWMRSSGILHEALGTTQVSNGVVLSFVGVRCDSIRKLIGASASEALLGRAMGRVLAHELYHVLLQTRTHGHSGLDSPSLTRAELTSPRIRFDDAALHKLTESLHSRDVASTGGF